MSLKLIIDFFFCCFWLIITTTTSKWGFLGLWPGGWTLAEKEAEAKAGAGQQGNKMAQRTEALRRSGWRLHHRPVAAEQSKRLKTVHQD